MCYKNLNLEIRQCRTLAKPFLSKYYKIFKGTKHTLIILGMQILQAHKLKTLVYFQEKPISEVFESCIQFR